jgi:hypothetical protein
MRTRGMLQGSWPSWQVGGELPYDPGTAPRRIKSNTFSHLPVLGSIRTAAEQLLIGAQYANNALLLDPPGLPTKKNYPDA